VAEEEDKLASAALATADSTASKLAAVDISDADVAASVSAGASAKASAESDVVAAGGAADGSTAEGEGPSNASGTGKGPLRERDEREHLNLVFIGHVDAGKSTFCGQILYQTDQVDARTIEKYEKEAKEKKS